MRKLFVLVLAAALSVGFVTAAQATSSYSVTVTVDKNRIDLGENIKLSGSVTPRAKGRSVKIQRRYAGGSWRTVATTKLSKRGTYSIRITPTQGGPTQYRVQKPGTTTRGTGTSAVRTVAVYRWLDLAFTTPDFATDSTLSSSRSEIAGAEFGSTVIADPGFQFIGWDLTTRACDRYRVYVGVSPQSVPGNQSSFAVTLFSSSAYLSSGSEQLDEELGMTAADHARVLSRALPATSNKHLGMRVLTENQGTSFLAEPTVHCNAKG